MPLPQFGSGLEVIAHHLVRTEAKRSADVRLMLQMRSPVSEFSSSCVGFEPVSA